MLGHVTWRQDGQRPGKRTVARTSNERLRVGTTQPGALDVGQDMFESPLLAPDIRLCPGCLDSRPSMINMSYDVGRAREFSGAG